MAGITLRTARQVVPMIYAYTTPEIARHNGWTKIGYTEQSVDKRLKQQTHTADVLFHEEWRGNAVYDDGSGEVFTDHDFHAYLRKLNVENDRKNEWFHLDGQQSRRYFQDFRMNRGRVQLDAAIAYTLREEQARAVRDTKTYYQSHPGGEYLWNAKPRFGKTLSVYDFCKQVDAQTVLIVTNRPAIANSWYSDYVRFLGRESGYLFVSHVDALAGQSHVLDEQGYAHTLVNRVGHGIGYSVHEGPYINQINHRHLERGMCFSIEPGVYLGGRFGMRVENIVCINEKGETEVLNKADRSLRVLDWYKK